MSSLEKLAAACQTLECYYGFRECKQAKNPCPFDSEVVCNKVCLEVLQLFNYKEIPSKHYRQLKAAGYNHAKMVKDKLVAKWICENCFTTQHVLMRKGPNGSGTLCNRCGIRCMRNNYDSLPLPTIPEVYKKRYKEEGTKNFPLKKHRIK